MSAVERPRERSNRRPIILLAGQAFALGLMVAWITIPASAIFLDAYGSGALPYTYLGAAVAGGIASAALTRAFRRRSLVSVAMRVLAALAGLLGASFAALWASGPWVSAVLLVFVPILVPVGFMFVVGQAGMLLDVRVLKVFYARVIAGFALGFVTGGVAAPVVLELIGRTESLLALAAVVAGVFLLLAWDTERRFPAQLSAADHAGADIVRPTVRSLLRNRYVGFIMAFQMLSAAESQWLDYLVFDRAAQRYESSEALAAFISRFTAIAYGADIVFLLLVAGVLLRRFGLRYGLAANSAVVLALLSVTIVFGSLQGSAGTVVFVLIVASRVSDLTLSDGASRASLSAAYQAVPPAERLAAQATVEGLAVPLAIGASGLVLIVLRETVGTNGLVLPLLTSLVVIAWMVTALFVHRCYRVNLLANLRHRRLDPSTLAVDDAHTLAAIDRLLDSADERDVRLGLHTLAAVDHPELTARLALLAVDERVGVRSHALDRLSALDPATAAASSRLGLSHPSAPVRAASLRSLGATGEPSDLPAIVAHWADSHAEVKLAAASAIARLGDGASKRRISLETTELSRSDDPRGPILAARVLATCGPEPGMDRDPLRSLLAHPDEDVVKAALAAIRWPYDAELLDDIIVHLENRRTSAATVDALARGGPALFDYIDQGLRGDHGFTRSGEQLLVRVGGAIGGPGAAAVLRRHLAHRDREVGLAVARALSELATSALDRHDANAVPAIPTPDEATDSMIRGDLEHAMHTLRALSVFGEDAAYAEVSRALRDELHLVQQRLLACMSIRYGAEGLNRVAFQLAQRDTRSHALALEWLDVTLTGTHRAFLALAEPEWSPEERRSSLGRWFQLPQLGAAEILRDIVEDPDDRWRRPWLTACALLAAVNTGAPCTNDVVAVRSPSAAPRCEPDVSIVEETLAGIRRRQTVATMPSGG